MERESRRRFMIGAAKAGVAAGAACWVAPRMSSVALAQEQVGTPPPDDERVSGDDIEPDEIEPEVSGTPSGTGTPTTDVAGRTLSATPGRSELPATGGDHRDLAILGGSAIAAGSALLAAPRLRAAAAPVDEPVLD